MTPNPDVLRLARSIAAHALCGPEKWKPGVKAGMYEDIMRGLADTEALVQAAIAAIERATELAKADVVAMNQKHGNPCGTKYEEGANDMAFRIHGRLDSYRHLRQPEKGSADE